MAEHFDVVVCGGGMVGATVACALGHAGINVALLEASEPIRNWPAEPIDIRVSALTKASQNILEAVGAWPIMSSRGLCAYREMRVWDGRGGGVLHFDCADTPYSELGYLSENRNTVAALWTVLESLPTVKCITPARVVHMQLLDDHRCLFLQNGHRITAGLVIAADGRDSPLRTMAGIGVSGWEYRQDGLVATVSTELSHRNTAWQRFLDQGPLAFLPLSNGQCSIVWTLDSSTAKQYMALDDHVFLRELEQASAGILGKMLSVGPKKAAFPLRFQYANQYVEQRFVLCGDAAHAMHPLAGQGVNTGLLDAAAIAELIIKAKQERRPLSSPKFLREYVLWRKGDNLLMQSSMDMLNKVYGVSYQPIANLRSIGMDFINRSDWIKRYINNYAMGLREDLPMLAKGHTCW